MLAKREANLAHRASGELARQTGSRAPVAPHRPGILRSIGRHLVLVVFLTALALVPAMAYVKLAKPLFTSTSNLLVRRTTVGAPSKDEAGQSQLSEPLSREELAAQGDVITSTPVLATALAVPGVVTCDPLRGHPDVIEFLKRSLHIEIKGGNQIGISIASTESEDAAIIVKAVVGAYSQFLTALRHGGNEDMVATLRNQKSTAQAEIAKKTADLLQFGEQHHVGGTYVNAAGDAELASLSEGVNEAHLASVRATAANDELNRALDSNPEHAQSLRRFEESSPASTNTGVDDEELLRSELLALKAKQAELQQQFMSGHPALVRIQQRIDELQLEHDASIQRNAVSTAQHEADLKAALDKEQQRVLEQAAQQAEYARRSTELATAQNAVDDLDQRIAALGLASNSDVPTVTVLDPAMASSEPSSPQRQRILLLAGGVGFLLSSLLAMALERGRSVNAGPVGNGLNVPVLADLPMVPTDFGAMGGGQERLLSAGGGLDEVFAGLRSVIDGAKMRGRGVIVLVTSPSRADGRSTLTSNLAVSLAQSHKRVLLVDADMRTPAQAKIFGTGNETGLAMLLEAEVSIPITAIHHTGIPSLDVIPAGPVTRNPSDLLNSQRFADLLGDMAERYDYILIDSPPTVTYTDSRTISASSDITMMVLRTDMLNRRMFQIASDGLSMVGANFCGVVLNSGLDHRRTEVVVHAESEFEQFPAPEPVETAARKKPSLLLRAAKAVDLVREPAIPRQSPRRSARKQTQSNGQSLLS